MSQLDRAIGSGIAWNLVGTLISKGSSIVFTLFLARFLVPEAFGLMSMIGICYALADALMTSGFGQSIIRQKEVTEDDLSTAFATNLTLGVVAYALLWSAAPWVADFYDQPALLLPLRATGAVLLVNALRVVQHALLTRAMRFRALMGADAVATVVAGAVAVAMARAGLGVWSLVAQFFLLALVSTALIWRAGGWRPRLGFSAAAFQRMFGFGLGLTTEGILNVLYENSYVMVIGRFFGPEVTGLYYFARRIRDLVVGQTNAAIQQATYPALSRLQDEPDSLREMYRRIFQALFFVVSLILAALAVLAGPMFEIAFGDRWDGAVWMLQLLCASGVFLPIHAVGYNMFKVLGRTDLLLYVGVLMKAIHLVFLVLGFPHGIAGILYGQVAAAALSAIPYMVFASRLLGYRWRMQLDDVLRPALAALLSATLCAVAADAVSPRAVWMVLLGGGTFAGVHLVVSGLLGVPGFLLVRDRVRSIIEARAGRAVLGRDV